MTELERKTNAIRTLAAAYQAEVTEMLFRCFIEVTVDYAPAEVELACREWMGSAEPYMPRPGQLASLCKRRRADLAVSRGRLARLEETAALARRSGNAAWLERCEKAMGREHEEIARLEGHRKPPAMPREFIGQTPRLIEGLPKEDRRKEIRVTLDNISQAKRLR